MISLFAITYFVSGTHCNAVLSLNKDLLFMAAQKKPQKIAQNPYQNS